MKVEAKMRREDRATKMGGRELGLYFHNGKSLLGANRKERIFGMLLLSLVTTQMNTKYLTTARIKNDLVISREV